MNIPKTIKVEELRNATNNVVYLINDTFNIKFSKSEKLFDEFVKMESCPTLYSFEYGYCIDTNEPIVIYLFENIDSSSLKYFAAIFFIKDQIKYKSFNIVDIKCV